jgi:hypothetical protein
MVKTATTSPTSPVNSVSAHSRIQQKLETPQTPRWVEINLLSLSALTPARSSCVESRIIRDIAVYGLHCGGGRYCRRGKHPKEPMQN